MLFSVVKPRLPKVIKRGMIRFTGTFVLYALRLSGNRENPVLQKGLALLNSIKEKLAKKDADEKEDITDKETPDFVQLDEDFQKNKIHKLNDS